MLQLMVKRSTGFVFLLGLAAVSATTGCDDDHTRLLEETHAGPIERIEIEVGAGQVEVVARDSVDGRDVSTDVDLLARLHGSHARLRSEVRGTTLHIESECASLFSTCKVDLNLIVPPAVSVDVGTGSGDVWIESTQGSANADTGSGSVTFNGVVGARLEGSTGSGDVIFKRASADVVVADTGSGDVVALSATFDNVDVDTGSGDVSLDLGNRATRIDVDTGSGDVGLVVPRGEYAVDVDTGSGDVRLDDIDDVGGADARISVDTGSGDVTLRGR